ncbi:hypothetical protein STXM2123_5854 [Streptomyces sp. F-3]|uniref:hypothetical protein n=1 Tax=Streptomyces TaxID=1883 RepID=UPI0007C2AEFE|nr:MULTISPECIES: hypothetical protein [Streptomyces]GAT85153.1 hypothetical protein STXM2123_5854 [Streptomyces sp. F-3]
MRRSALALIRSASTPIENPAEDLIENPAGHRDTGRPLGHPAGEGRRRAGHV